MEKVVHTEREDRILTYLNQWERENNTVIENIPYKDIRFISYALNIPETDIVCVIEGKMFLRNAYERRKV